MYARIISETRDAARACAGWLLFPFALVAFSLVYAAQCAFGRD